MRVSWLPPLLLLLLLKSANAIWRLKLELNRMDESAAGKSAACVDFPFSFYFYYYFYIASQRSSLSSLSLVIYYRHYYYYYGTAEAAGVAGAPLHHGSTKDIFYSSIALHLLLLPIYFFNTAV